MEIKGQHTQSSRKYVFWVTAALPLEEYRHVMHPVRPGT